MKYLKNLKWDMMWFSVVSVAMGILMFMFPNKIMKTLCIVIAAIFFLFGIKKIWDYRRKDSLGDYYKYKLVAGIISIIAGFAVLMGLDIVLSFITYVIAIIIIVSGLMKVENALDLKKMRCKWVPLMVFAVMCIFLGISVLMMPMNHNDDGTKTAGDFMIQCTGIMFAVTGLIDLITTLSVSGKINEWTVERNAKSADDEILMESNEDIG